jgi:hypothetical protein
MKCFLVTFDMPLDFGYLVVRHFSRQYARRMAKSYIKRNHFVAEIIKIEEICLGEKPCVHEVV